MGAAKSGRIAYGALLIKERLGITDEETARQITENPAIFNTSEVYASYWIKHCSTLR